MNEKLHITRRKHPEIQLKAILLRFLSHAETNAAGVAKIPGKHIHHLRTDMKNLRSALRLLEGFVDEKAYTGVMARIRFIKNAFAASRDDAVLWSICGKLEIKPAIVRLLHVKDVSSFRIPAPTIKKIHREILCLKKAIRALSFDGVCLRGVRRNFTRSLKRALKVSKRCKKDPSRERLHDWRKRVKDVWYQNQIMGKFGEDAKFNLTAARLSDLLGDGNDLELLAEKIAKSQLSECAELLSLIEKRINKIHRRVFEVSKRLFKRVHFRKSGSRK